MIDILIQIKSIALPSIAIDSSGSIYTTGFFLETVDFNPGTATHNITSAGDKDAFILQLDNDGNFERAINVGGTDDDGGIDIAVGPNTDIFTIGYFRQTVDFNPMNGEDNLTADGNDDIFIQKLNNTALINNIEDNPEPLNISVFPNPTSEKITLNLGQTYEKVILKIRMISGQLLFSNMYNTTNSIDFTINGERGDLFCGSVYRK